MLRKHYEVILTVRVEAPFIQGVIHKDDSFEVFSDNDADSGNLNICQFVEKLSN